MRDFTPRLEGSTPETADQVEQSAAVTVRVLVALGINPHSQRLLQTAARLADGLDGDLLALHVAPPGNVTSLYESNLSWHIEYARDLGAQVTTVEDHDVVAALIAFAKAQRVTHLVLGQSDVSRWREITRGSVINRMLRTIARQQVGIDLYIVTTNR